MQKPFACFSCGTPYSNSGGEKDEHEEEVERKQNRILQEQETTIQNIMKETYEARRQLKTANSKFVMIRKSNSSNKGGGNDRIGIGSHGSAAAASAANMDILDVDVQDIVVLPSDKSLFDYNDFDDDDDDGTDEAEPETEGDDWKNTTMDTASSSDNSVGNENENENDDNNGNNSKNGSTSTSINRIKDGGRVRNTPSSKTLTATTTVTAASETLVPIPIYKTADAQIQEIGKSLKKSKLTVTWSFQYGGERNSNFNSVLHFVTLTYSKCSGRMLIHMDGKQILSTKVDLGEPYFVRKWTLPTAKKKTKVTSKDKNNQENSHEENKDDGDDNNDDDGRLELQVVASRKLSSIFSLKDHELIVNGRRFSDLPDIMN